MSITSNSFKTFKPHTPGMRQTRLLNRHILLKNSKPLKNLRYGLHFGSGRNNRGQITSWHRGGGHKRLYRQIDFFRKQGIGLIEGIEYDPNRTSWIIRLFNPDLHEHSYILGVKGLKTGDHLRNYNDNKAYRAHRIKIGDHLFLKDVPTGFVIHNLNIGLKKKGQYLRAAGTYGQLITKTDKQVRIKLRSGEHRIFPSNASATLGPVCKEEHKFIKIGKAGRNSWLGIRPHVRGLAINPVDHPHGGGEGKTSGGRPSVTPWGKPTKGKPTVYNFNPLRVESRKKKKFK
jgi:large subunit ribosomal protein L2